MADDPETPHISIAAAVCIGLGASLVQSLGLTIQRKSHLFNESLPVGLRKRDYRRPLWCAGFAIFICSNLLGTIFQVGALPLVVLGPLGAVSLLYNAFFARIILGDQFSIQLIAGTILIAGGAVLIGIFGVVPEQTTHTLDELVAYYTRTPFLVWISLLAVALFGVIGLAHLTECALERRTLAAPLTPRTPSRKRPRRWSHAGARPNPPPLSFAQHPTSRSEPQYGTFDSRPDPIENNSQASKARPELAIIPVSEAKREFELSEEAVERSRLILGVAYGGASGTLSGLCLLFAKTGIELLILTVVGQNQFGHVEAWIIVLVLLFAALLQLFYLNRALRLVGPTLICPLAFCFYNLSSIVSGLVYYDQWDQLSWLQFGLVTLGTAILLGGVWLVSVIKKDGDEAPVQMVTALGNDPYTDEPDGMRTPGDEDSDEEDETDDSDVEWIPRGLTIGIGAASPGFDIRPIRPRRRATLASLPIWHPPSPSAAASSRTPGANAPTERSALFPASSRGTSHRRTLSSDAELEATAGQNSPGQTAAQKRRAYRERGRTTSLSHAPYVGRRSSDGGGLGSPLLGSFTAPDAQQQQQGLQGLGLAANIETAVERDEVAQREAEARRKKAGWKKFRARFASSVVGSAEGERSQGGAEDRV